MRVSTILLHWRTGLLLIAAAASAAAEPSPAPAVATAPRSEAQKILDARQFYDPENPDLHALQKPDVALRELPRDRHGFVDWMRAIREGTLNPRATLDGRSAMKTLDLDVLLKDTREMPWVRFPHLSHTMWLDCSNCHPKPFEPRAGANDISMADIFRGKYCGMCHDRVAFITFFSCDRCHSVPQEAAGKK